MLLNKCEVALLTSGFVRGERVRFSAKYACSESANQKPMIILMSLSLCSCSSSAIREAGLGTRGPFSPSSRLVRKSLSLSMSHRHLQRKLYSCCRHPATAKIHHGLITHAALQLPYLTSWNYMPRELSSDQVSQITITCKYYFGRLES